MFGSRGYQWVLDADIEACFDRIDHLVLMGQVRSRIKDKRVLALVKAFLKAGVMTETGHYEDSDTGTPQGGILSPLLANIALSVLDEHVMAPWRPDGVMGTTYRRNHRRSKGLPTWRIVRYADDFVVLVYGQESDVVALREDIANVLAPLGLRFSESKTRIVHMREGFDFLGFHIQWKCKRGTRKWFVYTVHRRPSVPVSGVESPCPDTSCQPSGYGSCGRQDQPDPARPGQLLPACGVQAHAQPAAPLRQLAHHPLVAQVAPLAVEGVPPQVHHPYGAVASDRSRWSRGIQPGSGDGESLPVPREPHPQPVPAADNSLTASDRGEPGAWRRARRVRRAARGNGAAAMPTPRPGSTQPSHRPSGGTCSGRVQALGHKVQALESCLLSRKRPAGPH